MTTQISRLRGAPPLLIVFFAVFGDMLGYAMIVPLLPFLREAREGQAGLWPG
jgi:hypothetical protein